VDTRTTRLGVLLFPRERRQGVAKIADELRRVRFTWPEGFDEDECRFWAAGLDGKAIAPFGERLDKALIVSPLSQTRLCVSSWTKPKRPIWSLAGRVYKNCHKRLCNVAQVSAYWHRNLPTNLMTMRLRLNAVKFWMVCTQNSLSSIAVGTLVYLAASFNATVHALRHNVEFMVELVGKKSQFGVDQFLRQVKGEATFADLLKEYDRTAPRVPADATAQQLDDLIQATKRTLAAAGPRLVVTATGETESFDMSMEWTREPPQATTADRR